jgi:hypothetical protein
MITQEQKNLLQLMKEDIEKGNELFKASPLVWKSLSSQFESQFHQIGIERVSDQEYAHFFVTPHPLRERTGLYSKYAIWLYYQYLKLRDKFGILEKTEPIHVDPLFQLDPVEIRKRQKFDTKILTWEYLISVDDVLSIAEQVPEILTEEVVVGDLGAGWGRIGHILLQINKKASYNVFDIPQTLLIAHEYLSKHVPDEVKVYDYRHCRENFEVSTPGVRFFGSNFLEKMEDKAFDVFINVASFQEMTEEQVNMYINLIDKKAKNFFTWQRWDDQRNTYDTYNWPGNWELLYERDMSYYPLWFQQMYRIH